MSEELPCPDENVLMALLEGELAPEQIEGVHTHVDGCEACRELIGEFGHLIEVSGEGSGVDSGEPSSESSDHGDAHNDSREYPRVDRYEIRDLLGSGGMGLVYLAFDPDLDRQVALKVLHSTNEHSPRRILREARAMARVSHPHVVQVHEVGEYDGGLYVAMECVTGTTLDRWARGRPWRERVDACCAAGEGLAAAHAVGLVHRDFKPANVLCGEDGQIKVTDFGLAAPERAGLSTPAPTLVTEHDDADGTLTGLSGGTPGYMAPEQQRGERADARADQFSFCVATWEVLLGERPTGPDHGVDASGAGDRGDRAERVIAALRRGLEPDPHDRWPSMSALLDELRYEPRSTKREWIIGMVSATTVAGLAAGAFVWSASAPPCRDAGRAAMDALWSDEQQQDVRQALLAGGEQFEQTHALVKLRLDEYADAWTAMSRSACEATLVEHTQSTELLDLRTACLERAADSMRVAIDILRRADADARANAHTLVGKLPRLEPCADAAGLRARIPPPDEPQVARAVASLGQRLETAKQHRISGQFRSAAALLDALAADVEATDYEPLIARFEYERAWDLHTRGEFSRARTRAEAAVQRALRSEQWTLAGDLSRLLGDINAKLASPEEATVHARAALALAERARGDPRRRGAAHRALGEAALVDGDLDIAEQHMRRGLALTQEAVGSTSPEAGSAHNDLAVTLHYLGRHQEAEAEHQRALEILTAVFGPAHPEVARSQDNLGQLLADMGQYARADTLHRSAVATMTDALGASHPLTANATMGFANALVRKGELLAAVSAYRRALDGLSQAIGPHHPDTAAARSSLGSTLISLGEREDGLAQVRMSVADQIAGLGAEHPRVVVLRNNLAVELADAGLLDESFQEFAAVIEIRERILGRHHPETLESLRDLGHARLQGESLDEAEAAFLEVLDRLESVDEPVAGLAGHAYYGLGVLTRRRGELEAARGWLRSAVDARSNDDGAPGLTGHAEFLLARVLWSLDERDEAVEVARSAERSYREAGAHRDDLRQSVAEWLESHSP